MSAQERVAKPRARDAKGRYVAEQASVPQERSPEVEAALEATDELLDEIDALLDDVLGETSAQDFVNDFVQKGGE